MLLGEPLNVAEELLKFCYCPVEVVAFFGDVVVSLDNGPDACKFVEIDS